MKVVACNNNYKIPIKKSTMLKSNFMVLIRTKIGSISITICSIMILNVWKTRSKKDSISNQNNNRRSMNYRQLSIQLQMKSIHKIPSSKLAKLNWTNWSNLNTDLLKFSSRNLFTLTMRQFVMRLLAQKSRDLSLKTIVWKPMFLKLRLATLICLMFKEKWSNREILKLKEVAISHPSSSSISTSCQCLRAKQLLLAKILMPLRIAMITCCKETVVWRKSLLPFKSMPIWFNFRTRICRESLMNLLLLMILSDLDLTAAKKSTTLDSV